MSPSKQSGRPGSLVAPAEPLEAEPADEADPGEVAKAKAEQIQDKSGKYGSTPVPAYKAPEAEEEGSEEKDTAWIEIELTGEDEGPIVGERYRITLSDGETVDEGTLNDEGLARLEGIEAGTCRITFPDLDQDAWEQR